MTKHYKELIKHTREELIKQQTELEKELMKSNTQRGAGTAPKSPAKFKTTKKTIAQIKQLLAKEEQKKQ